MSGGICPKTNSFAPLFLINGKEFKLINPDGSYYSQQYEGRMYNTVCNPSIGYTEQSEQLVQSTRNALGQVVAEPINRRLNKLESLSWPYLSRQSVNWLKKEIAKFFVDLSYWDSEKGQWVTKKYYWGDFSATPCEWETVQKTGTNFYYKRPIWYKDVKCNLIDCGY